MAGNAFASVELASFEYFPYVLWIKHY